MPNPTGDSIISMSLSDIKEMARMISDVVTNDVLSSIEGFHYKTAAGVIGALVSAIIYMYLTQKSDQQKSDQEKIEAYNKLFAVIEESTKTMESVKNGLGNSIQAADRVENALDELKEIVAQCKHKKKEGE